MTYIPIEEQKRIFANNLQKYIRISEKEQKQICADLGINEPTFSQWVNGLAIPRDISTIRKLADYFNVGLTKLTDPDFENDSASSKEIEKAMRLYKNYQNAIPQIQEAVENLLKFPHSDLQEDPRPDP